MYFSRALYNHSIPIRLKNSVDEISIYRVFSEAIWGIAQITIAKIVYVVIVAIAEIIESSWTVRESFSLLSLYLAQILTPYVGM